MKNLSTATSVESDDFPDRFSDTWERRSSTDGAAERHSHRSHGSGLLGRLQQRLPRNRCWTSLIASAAITTFIVGGVLLIVALLVRHHDEQIEKLERSRNGVISATTRDWAISHKVLDLEKTTAKPATVLVINYCASRPCLNGGTCLNRLNFSECLCPTGFIPPVCAAANATPATRLVTILMSRSTRTVPTTLPRICYQRPCINGGICYPPGQCQCVGPYSGRYCQNSAKGICASSPCMYGTNCTEINGGSDYVCSCPDGLSGKRCEQIRCGSNTTLPATASTAVIRSPDYPNDGLPSLNCTWSMTAQHFYVKLVIEDIQLTGSSCNESYLDVHDTKTQVLVKRYCPSNISATVFESRGTKSIQIRYVSSPGSYFRLAYSSPDIDPCLYYNNANCTHGKCWPEEGKATCVCDACYRGIGCSEIDQGNCTDSYCANGGTCTYNCYVETHRCLCPDGYDPRTNCAQRCADTRRC